MSAPRNAFLVCYDIASPRRWRKVFKMLRREGDHMQYSVFLAHWSPGERRRAEDRLHELLDEEEDRLLVVDLGPSDGTLPRRISGFGTPCELHDAKAYVL